MLAGQRSADDGVAELVRNVQAGEYNRHGFWSGTDSRSTTLRCPPTRRRWSSAHPGRSCTRERGAWRVVPKVDRIRSLVSAARSANTTLWTALPSVLADHTVPVTADGSRARTTPLRDGQRPCFVRTHRRLRNPLFCLDTGPEDLHARPEMLVADGPPCTAPFVDVGYRWDR